MRSSNVRISTIVRYIARSSSVDGVDVTRRSHGGETDNGTSMSDARPVFAAASSAAGKSARSSARKPSAPTERANAAKSGVRMSTETIRPSKRARCWRRIDSNPPSLHTMR